MSFTGMGLQSRCFLPHLFTQQFAIQSCIYNILPLLTLHGSFEGSQNHTRSSEMWIHLARLQAFQLVAETQRIWTICCSLRNYWQLTAFEKQQWWLHIMWLLKSLKMRIDNISYVSVLLLSYFVDISFVGLID